MMLSAKFGENGPLGSGKEMYKQPSMEMMILRVKTCFACTGDLDMKK